MKAEKVKITDLGSEEYSLRFPIYFMIGRSIDDRFYIGCVLGHTFFHSWDKSKEGLISELKQSIIDAYQYIVEHGNDIVEDRIILVTSMKRVQAFLEKTVKKNG